MERIRITADTSQAFVKSQKKVQSIPRASFPVRHRVRGAIRRERRNKALAITSIVHLLALFAFIYLYEPEAQPYDDVIAVEMVNEILEQRKVIKPKPREVKQILSAQVPVDAIQRVDTTVQVQTDAARFRSPETESIDLKVDDALPSDSLTTDANLPSTGDIPAGTTSGTQNIASGTGVGHGSGNKARGFGDGKFLGKGQSTGEGDATHTPDGDLSTRVDNDKLGAVLEGTPQEPSGHIRIIRLKHNLSDWWHLRMFSRSKKR